MKIIATDEQLKSIKIPVDAKAGFEILDKDPEDIPEEFGLVGIYIRCNANNREYVIPKIYLSED